MSRVCQICGRGPKSSLSRSHSHIGAKRTLAVNLQTKKINGRKIKICASCLKSRLKSKK